MADITPSDATPGALLLLSGGALGLAGGLCALVALQFLMWWTVPFVAKGVLVGMGALGVTAVLLAWFTSDGRAWAAIPGAIAAPIVGVVSAVWAVWAVSNLSFTLFMFFTPPAALLAALLMPFAIRASLRCGKARAMVAASGPMFGVS